MIWGNVRGGWDDSQPWEGIFILSHGLQIATVRQKLRTPMMSPPGTDPTR